MTPRTVLILCERAPVKVNPVPAVRYGLTEPESQTQRGGNRDGLVAVRDEVPTPSAGNVQPDSGSVSPYRFECSYCGRRVQVVA